MALVRGVSFPVFRFYNMAPSVCALLRELDDPHLMAREEEDVKNYPYLRVNKDKLCKIEQASGAPIPPDLCKDSRCGESQIEGRGVHIRLLDRKPFKAH